MDDNDEELSYYSLKKKERVQYMHTHDKYAYNLDL